MTLTWLWRWRSAFVRRCSQRVQWHEPVTFITTSSDRAIAHLSSWPDITAHASRPQLHLDVRFATDSFTGPFQVIGEPNQFQMLVTLSVDHPRAAFGRDRSSWRAIARG